MKKEHFFLSTGGFVALFLLFFLGGTTPPKKNVKILQESSPVEKITFSDILSASKQKLTITQQAFLNQLESSVVRGNVKDQQLETYHQLAAFWADSGHAFLPFAYYTGQAAKLENIEKSLTFAARLFLDKLPDQQNPVIKTWMAEQAKELFEQAVQLNPANDSLKVGLGSCYIFGNIGSNPMEGISLIRGVAEKNPNHVYAQMTLGLGGMMTGQFDKAIERFKKVFDLQPDNVEAILNLAEAYEQKGERQIAVEWYQKSKPLIKNTDILKEIDNRINGLKKGSN